MTLPYGAGIAAAIAAGIIFNTGLVVQKLAVSRLPAEGPLVLRLLRSPLWLAGLVGQFLVGTPLSLLAALRVGPALLPGLLATGLIAMAVAAVLIAHESLTALDVGGILVVVAGTALIGASRLAVDMNDFEVWQPGFHARLAVFASILLALAGIGRLLERRLGGARGALRALGAGLLFTLSNQSVVVVVGMLTDLLSGTAPRAGLAGAAVVGAVAAGASALGVLQLQRAFQSGEASRLVPISQGPQQVLPPVVYFAVYRLTAPSTGSLLALCGGVLAILAGSLLLGRRQAAVR